jgi:hypothetical protein
MAIPKGCYQLPEYWLWETLKFGRAYSPFPLLLQQ